MRLALASLIFWSSLWASVAGAATPDFEAPYLSRPVMDEVRLLSPSDLDRVEGALRGLREASGIQLAVYIPESLRGLDIESFSMEVAEQWKLGKKGVDRGLLLVLAPSERRMRLEVGYGLEGQLTDAMSRRILDGVLRPYLREGRAADGLLAVVGAVAQITGSEFKPSGMESIRPPRRRRGEVRLPFWVQLVIALFLLASAVVMRLGRVGRGFRAGRRYQQGSGIWWSGGGGGGLGGGSGGWSGGGGGFGGGGASSNW